MVLKLPTPVPATGLSCTMANVEAQVYARKLTDWKRLEAYTPANTTAAANSTAAPILILCKCFLASPPAQLVYSAAQNAADAAKPSHAPLLSVKNKSTAATPSSTSRRFCFVRKNSASTIKEENTTKSAKKFGLACVEKIRVPKKPRHGKASSPGSQRSSTCTSPYRQEIHAASTIHLVSTRAESLLKRSSTMSDKRKYST